MRIENLIESLPDSYSSADLELVQRAYRVTEKAHQGQTRASGEPYISHCLSVASILAELCVPPVVIAAGLLHDTVEDTEVTLIRTYAEEYDADPEIVFYAANNRLLKDARANLFITTFYGILNPIEGTFTYCNAGHNPPYLIRDSGEKLVDSLTRTGIAMGIEANSTWTTDTITINPGDILVLYTDGIPDSQDQDGDFFNDEAIIDITRKNAGRLANEIQSSIIEAVQEFSGTTPQSDDITLMVLVRDK